MLYTQGKDWKTVQARYYDLDHPISNLIEIARMKQERQQAVPSLMLHSLEGRPLGSSGNGCTRGGVRSG
jgi:hypothetical protein